MHNLRSESRLVAMLCVAILAVGIVAFCVHLRTLMHYTMDDSFITFRYAANFAGGHGLVFNPRSGERAEGLTSPLYASVLAILSLSGLSFTVIAKAVGVGAAIGAVIVAGRLAHHLVGPSGGTRDLARVAGAGTMAYLLGDQYFAGNALSGMETAISCFATIVFLSLLLASQRAPQRTGLAIWTGVAAVVVPMLRPEMALTVLFMLAALLLLQREARRSAFLVGATFCVLGLSYFCWRYGYYQLPFPLPFYIKQGSHGLPGWNDVKLFIESLWVLVLAALVATLLPVTTSESRKTAGGAFVLALLGATVVQLAYLSTVHQIMGLGFRYFQPTMVGLVVLAFVGVAAVAARFKIDAHRAVTTALVIGAGITFHSARGSESRALLIDYYANLERGVSGVAVAMTESSQRKPLTIALNDCGVIPFVTGFETVDLGGLNNKAIALNWTAEGVLAELRRTRPDIVILVQSKPMPDSAMGWEKIYPRDLAPLGLSYAGSVRIDEGYWYGFYVRMDPDTQGFIEGVAHASGNRFVSP